MTDSELPMLFWRVKHKNALTLTVAARRASADGLLTESPISVLEVSSRTNRASSKVFKVSSVRTTVRWSHMCRSTARQRTRPAQWSHPRLSSSTRGSAGTASASALTTSSESSTSRTSTIRKGFRFSFAFRTFFVSILHHAGKRFFRKSSSD